MKKLFYTIAIAVPSFACAICPLHQEEPHFVKYRSMCIEASNHAIDQLAKQLLHDDISVEEAVHEINYHTKNIKFNLGNSQLVLEDD